jgi:hypothetical protein
MNNNIGFLNNKITHLFHGDYKKRKYISRDNGLFKYGFDPLEEVCIGDDGLYEWVDVNKSRMLLNEFSKYIGGYESDEGNNKVPQHILKKSNDDDNKVNTNMKKTRMLLTTIWDTDDAIRDPIAFTHKWMPVDDRIDVTMVPDNEIDDSFKGKYDVCVVVGLNSKIEWHKKIWERINGIFEQVFCIRNSQTHDIIEIDPLGYSGGASTVHDLSPLNMDSFSPSQVTTGYNTLYEKYIEGDMTGIPNKTPFNYNGEFLLFAGQVPHDLTIISGLDIPSRYFNVVIEALWELNKIGIPIMYKSHPYINIHKDLSAPAFAINKMIEEGMFENVDLVLDASPNEMLSKCKAVITINSHMGFEGLMHLKPVITLGRAEYGMVTHTPESLSDLSNVMDYVNSPISDDTVKRFLLGYHEYRYFSIIDKKIFTDKILRIIDYEKNGCYSS